MEPLLEELHEGICGSHIGGRSLAHMALTRDIGGLGLSIPLRIGKRRIPINNP